MKKLESDVPMPLRSASWFKRYEASVHALQLLPEKIAAVPLRLDCHEFRILGLIENLGWSLVNCRKPEEELTRGDALLGSQPDVPGGTLRLGSGISNTIVASGKE